MKDDKIREAFKKSEHGSYCSVCREQFKEGYKAGEESMKDRYCRLVEECIYLKEQIEEIERIREREYLAHENIIGDLKKQIEAMKCCGNCRYSIGDNFSKYCNECIDTFSKWKSK